MLSITIHEVYSFILKLFTKWPHSAGNVTDKKKIPSIMQFILYLGMYRHQNK